VRIFVFLIKPIKYGQKNHFDPHDTYCQPLPQSVGNRNDRTKIEKLTIVKEQKNEILTGQECHTQQFTNFM